MKVGDTVVLSNDVSAVVFARKGPDIKVKTAEGEVKREKIENIMEITATGVIDAARSYSARQVVRKPPKQKQWHELKAEGTYSPLAKKSPRRSRGEAAEPIPPAASPKFTSPLQKRLNATGRTTQSAQAATGVMSAFSSTGNANTMRNVASREGYIKTSALSAGVPTPDVLALYDKHYHHPVRLPEAKILLSKGTIIDSDQVDLVVLSDTLDAASQTLIELGLRAKEATAALGGGGGAAAAAATADGDPAGDAPFLDPFTEKVGDLKELMDLIRLQCGALAIAHEEAWGKTSEANQQAFEADLDLESMHGHLQRRAVETEALERVRMHEARNSRKVQMELEETLLKLNIRNTVDLSHVKRSKKDFKRATKKNTQILMDKLRLEDELAKLKSTSRAEITTLKTALFRTNQRAEQAEEHRVKEVAEAKREVRATKRMVHAKVDEACAEVEHKLKSRINELRFDISVRDGEINELRETVRETQEQLKTWDANAANEAMKRILYRLAKVDTHDDNDAASATLDSVLTTNMDALEELHHQRARANFYHEEIVRLRTELQAATATAPVQVIEEPPASPPKPVPTPQPSTRKVRRKKKPKRRVEKKGGGDDGEEEEEQLEDCDLVEAMLRALKEDSQYTQKEMANLEPRIYGQIVSESFSRGCGEDFDAVDIDRNGVLTPDEIYPLIADLAQVNEMSVTLQQCREFAAIFGKDGGSGIVTRLEFVEFCRTILVMQYLHDHPDATKRRGSKESKGSQSEAAADGEGEGEGGGDGGGMGEDGGGGGNQGGETKQEGSSS